MSSLASPRIDVREITPRDRHALIFNAIEGLKDGEALELVNDHDPVPLRFQFEDRLSGRFEWAYLESGPELWRVRIGRLPESTSARNSSCCSGGACGG